MPAGILSKDSRRFMAKHIARSIESAYVSESKLSGLLPDQTLTSELEIGCMFSMIESDVVEIGLRYLRFS